MDTVESRRLAIRRRKQLAVAAVAVWYASRFLNSFLITPQLELVAFELPRL